MAGRNADHEPSDATGAKFAATRWSLVVQAGNTASPEAGRALETLCRAYWYPLYAYVRWRGFSSHDAQDLTQGFFLYLLQHKLIASADPNRGKFRTYLLSAFNNFLNNEWDKLRAQKRCCEPGQKLLPEELERRYQQEGICNASPDKLYDRHWGMVLLEQALQRLQDEFASANKFRLFELLQHYLDNEPVEGDYARLGAQLEFSPNRVAVEVHRLRQRHRELIRHLVAETVANPRDVDEELRSLFG